MSKISAMLDVSPVDVSEQVKALREVAAKVDRAQVAEDLRATARYIDKHGWIQEDSWNDLGQVCAMGGLSRCLIGKNLGQHFDSVNRVTACQVALADYLNVEVLGGIPDWNDELPAVTGKATVIEAFEKAAARVEEIVTDE